MLKRRTTKKNKTSWFSVKEISVKHSLQQSGGMYTHGEKGIKDGGKKDLWHSFSTRSPAGKVLSSDAEPGKALWQNHTHTQCGRKSVKAVGPLFSWCDLTEIGLQDRKSRTLGLPWLHGWRQCWATPGNFFPQYWFFSLLAAEEPVAGGESELPRLPTLTLPGWPLPSLRDPKTESRDQWKRAHGGPQLCSPALGSLHHYHYSHSPLVFRLLPKQQRGRERKQVQLNFQHFAHCKCQSTALIREMCKVNVLASALS